MPNQHTAEWTHEIEQRALTLSRTHSVKDITQIINDEYQTNISYNAVRNKIKRLEEQSDNPTYKEQVNINQDDTIYSDKLIEMSEQDMKDKNYLLKAHGFDPSEWEVTKSESSKWHHHNKQDGTKTLYASKLTVKPKTNGFNFDRLLEVIHETPQVTIKPIQTRQQSYLNIPLADMHFGIATYDDYEQTQSKIVNHIQKGHEEILFVLGNDLLHHDNHRNQTASGRDIQEADMVQAWEDAKQFYYPLIEYALRHAKRVKVMYIKGNHSETLEWAFIQMLKTRFPQVTFDDDLRERKAHMLGLNLIFANHGDKKKMQNLSENFATEFPQEWSQAKTRTVFTGHLHHEKVIDKGGIIIRQLPTGVKDDGWHTDMGYTTAHKRFQIHEYSYECEEAIYYV